MDSRDVRPRFRTYGFSSRRGRADAFFFIYFSNPHRLARRVRERDSRPDTKPLGLFARLDRVPDCLIDPPAARPVVATANIETIANPAPQFRLLTDFIVNLFDFLSLVIQPWKGLPPRACL
jgi:hypothetical protein